VLARKRQEYHNWVEQHYEIDDVERSEDELAILHQIQIDVPRTAAVVDLFHKPEIQKYAQHTTRGRNYIFCRHTVILNCARHFLLQVTCAHSLHQGDKKSWHVLRARNERLGDSVLGRCVRLLNSAQSVQHCHSVCLTVPTD
jgi:hypothetical protein